MSAPLRGVCGKVWQGHLSNDARTPCCNAPIVTADVVGARVSYLSALRDRIEDATGWMSAWAVTLAEELLSEGLGGVQALKRYKACREHRALAQYLLQLEQEAVRS